MAVMAVTGSDHPRIRGEHVRRLSADGRTGGSSPHTRGAPEKCAPHHSLGPDHPRIRGEHILEKALSEAGQGSSPHTRGALRLL